MARRFVFGGCFDVTAALALTLAQINPIVGDLPYNLSKIRNIRDAATRTGELIVFPELALCGYPPEDLVRKPFFLDRVDEAIRALAEESRAHPGLMILPAPIRRRGRAFNGIYAIGHGRVAATRTKHHLPDYGVFDESRVFMPGPLPAPLELGDHRIGVMICEDMWHPDVAAHLKKLGADLLISVNASPWEVGKDAIRKDHAARRVRDTGLPLVYVNQVGGQDELVFDGASFAMDTDGTVVFQAPDFAESVSALTLSKTPSGRWHVAGSGGAALREGPEAIWAALCLGLKDYVEKNGFPGVLIGLSGGIDSALCAAIAVDALGPGRVRCVMMPSPYTAPESVEDAATLARALGVRLESVSIDIPMQAFGALLKPHLKPDTPSVTYENIQPRCRGLILMALSNASGFLVLSTGNKSEMAVGYATLYGDMCGGFNPLKDLYKNQVYALAHWRNARAPGGALIPQRILTRAPTAELKPNQTDQDTLPPYDILDDILEALIEQDLGLSDIVARGHDPAVVAKVWKMLDAAEYKRRQASPGLKITARAFGRDRRYPITNHFTKVMT